MNPTQDTARFSEETVQGVCFDKEGNSHPLQITVRIEDSGLLGHATVMGYTSSGLMKEEICKDDVVSSLSGMFDDVEF